MKTKRVPFIIGVIAILMLTVLITVYANSSLHDIWFNAGQQNQAPLRSNAQNEPAVAHVNGEAISRQSFERYKTLGRAAARSNAQLLEQTQPNAASKEQIDLLPDDEALLTKLIQKRVKLQEAQRLGLCATDEEVAQYFEQQENAKKSADPEAVALADNIIQAYCDGLGMTRTQYREQIETQMVREEITLGKLTAELIKQIDVAGNATREDRKARLDAYFEKLMEEANIKLE